MSNNQNFIQRLEIQLGMKSEDWICGDYDDKGWCFKPMSDSGKKDLQYVANIKKLFDKKGIQYQHNTKIPRVFSVNKSEFKKL